MNDLEQSVDLMVMGIQEIRVNSLANVPKYISEKKSAVIIDLDGVLCCRGKENNVLANASRLKSLLKVVENSDRVLFSTARFDLGREGFWSNLFREKVEEKQNADSLAVSYCPFLTEKSKKNLRLLIGRKNSDCLVDFDATPKKYLGKNERTLNFARESLDDGLNLTIIGSGFFDRMVTRRIVDVNHESFGRVNFFSLGLGLF